MPILPFIMYQNSLRQDPSAKPPLELRQQVFEFHLPFSSTNRGTPWVQAQQCVHLCPLPQGFARDKSVLRCPAQSLIQTASKKNPSVLERLGPALARGTHRCPRSCPRAGSTASPPAAGAPCTAAGDHGKPRGWCSGEQRPAGNRWVWGQEGPKRNLPATFWAWAHPLPFKAAPPGASCPSSQRAPLYTLRRNRSMPTTVRITVPTLLAQLLSALRTWLIYKLFVQMSKWKLRKVQKWQSQAGTRSLPVYQPMLLQHSTPAACPSPPGQHAAGNRSSLSLWSFSRTPGHSWTPSAGPGAEAPTNPTGKESTSQTYLDIFCAQILKVSQLPILQQTNFIRLTWKKVNGTVPIPECFQTRGTSKRPS